jgi:hypothetical protein
VVLPFGFKDVIARLDPTTFTVLMGRLLAAEAQRLGLGAGAVVTSDALTEGDGGLDARVAGPSAGDDGGRHLPQEESGFQFKTNRDKNKPGVLRLPKEIKRPGPTAVLKNGGTYVLAWSQDLNPRQRDLVDAALLAAAKDIVDDPNVEVWDAERIHQLCELHEGVVVGLELAGFNDVRSLEEVLRDDLLAEKRPFYADAVRDAAIERIRERIRATNDTVIMWVAGDGGVGKTRTVVEALKDGALAESCFYVSTARDVTPFVVRAVRARETTGILVLDEATVADLNAVRKRFEGTRGRWRVIAVGTRTDRERTPEGGRNIELSPLDEAASQRLGALCRGRGVRLSATGLHVGRGASGKARP